MTKKERLQMEMLVRVRDFGAAHSSLFPESTIADESFAAVDEAVKHLTEFAGSKVMATRGSVKRKIAARAALRTALLDISRTARAIVPQEPAFQNRFQLPRRQAGAVLITVARAFARHAEAFAPRFIERGLPESFLADLQSVTDAYEDAVRSRDVARQQNDRAQAMIGASIAAGVEAVQQLDVLVANRLRGDPGTFAAWRQARHVPWPKDDDDAQPAPPVDPSTTKAA